MPQRRQDSRRARLSSEEVEALFDELDDAMQRFEAERAADIMERLNANRKVAADVLTARLSEGRGMVPAFEFELLQMLAGSRGRTLLRRIASSASAPDIVRFGAARRAGWPERGEGKRRLSFLEGLESPDETLVHATLQGCSTWPPNGEILTEVLGYLLVLPPERARAIVLDALEGTEGKCVWLAHALLHSPDPETQKAVLASLARRRDPGSVGPIRRMAELTRREDVRQEARAALRRLNLQVIGGNNHSERRALPPVGRVVMTALDGAGGQAILVSRDLGNGLFIAADFFHNETWGVKDAFGASWVQGDRVGMMIEDFEDDRIPVVEVDLPAARGALADALRTNAETGHAIPPAFEIWEPMVHESYPPPDQEPFVTPELDDSPFERREDLLDQSPSLLSHRFFTSWFFSPELTAVAVLQAPPPGRKGITDAQLKPMVRSIVNPKVRQVLRQRLCKQAWLLDRQGDERERDLSLAAAASLRVEDPNRQARNPFLQAMVGLSLANLFSAYE